MKKNLLTTVLASVSVVFSLCGCLSSGGEIGEKIWSQADRIEYHFNDSSVPPDCHRSYTLVITPESAKIKVTSYGDKLLDKTYGIDSEQFRKVVEELRGLGIRKQRSRDVNPCSGGTTEVFRLYAGTTNLFDGFQDNCEERRSTMIVAKKSIPDVLDMVFPKSVKALVDETRKDRLDI